MVLLPVLVLFVFVFAVSASARTYTPSATTVAGCLTAKVLNTGGSNSNFEIDTNANLTVDGAAPCIDWLSGGSGTGFRSGASKQQDVPSGQNDNSFGQGTQENDTNAPTIIAGSIPNNKSDLMWFGGYQEPSSPKTLELFWSRVQSPEGTTNMDFELNQKACPGSCSANGVTPVRTAGDKLITYDLSKGGTVPSISIRQWLGSVWGPADVVSDGANPTALGAVNTSSIAANDSGGIGALDAFTFGEAAISYQALFGGTTGCTTLGSVYVKSRSSDSFNAELKDFIAPRPITVSNCTTISTTLSSTSVLAGGSVHDSATLGNATADAGGTVTYTAYTNSACTQGARDAGTKTVSNGVVPDSNDLTFDTPGDFYWQASYSGDGNNAASKSVCTEEHLVVLATNPKISIAKTPDSQTVLSGATASFTISVTNSGNVTLTNVRVTDALAPGCARTSTDIPALASMAPGANVTYSCALADVTAGFTNQADATGTPPSGPDVTASDTAVVTVINPAISIAKTPDSQTIVSGTTATFTIKVTNTGDATLTNVFVTDALAPGCARTQVAIPALASMAPGASVSYDCTLANVTASFTNSATASGTPPLGPPVTATDTADVTVIHPAITIAKTPDSQQVQSGGTVTFTIKVTNSGDVTLTNVVVTDALAPGCARTSAVIPALASMAPAATVSYDCTLANVAASFTNSATATGTPPVGPDVTATDTADVTVIHPAITIAKTPDSQQVVSGGTATFTITVTNSGDVTLTNVVVTDAQAPGCARTSTDIPALASMAPTASLNYSCTKTAVAASFTNSATATGTPPVGPDVTATDTADVTVIHPAITIAKTPDSQQVQSGGTVTFTIKVTNSGDVTLTNVVVTDAQAPGCARTKADIAGLASMAPAAIVSYDCTRASVAASFTNSATATGTPPVGPDVTATDTADVTVINPAITIAKTPDSQQVVSGGTASFTIKVTNSGDVTLTNVRVTDALAPGCARTSTDIAALASMAPQAIVTYTCTLTNVTASFTNSATATGTPPVGPDVTATDTADVTVIHPAITIAKTPDSQSVQSGGTVTFTIKVTNSGDVTLTNVRVTDAQAPGCARTSTDIPALASMAPTATVSYDCTKTAVATSFTNSATATGTPPVGPDVTATDTADVTVIHPAITIAKTPDSQQVQSGGTVTFTIKVTNSGDVTLTNVVVTDALAPGCARTSAVIPALASMAPAATVSYDCTLANVAASFTNSATATGTPPVGPDVTATDTADVTVIHPAITVAKTPDSQSVQTGGTVTFTIKVTNTGDVTLTNVVVTDALAPGCARTKTDIAGLASMAPTASISYDCTLANVAASFTNSATATGTPPVGPDVTATDTADVTVIHPAITVAKTPDSQTIVSGTTATFTIKVTNTGDVTLTNVVVTDAQAPGCARTKADIADLASMAPKASVDYDCTKESVTAGFTNSATATGTPPVGPDVTATDTADVTVINPAITIAKTPDSQQVVSGGTASFTIKVTNSGDVTLTNVVVTDALAPGCARTSTDLPALASMEPDASVTYDCTLADVTAGFTNTATATGTPPAGPDVTASDTAHVSVTQPPGTPGISIVKSPDTQTVASGGLATFSVTVTNTGSVTLTNVIVTDLLTPSCNRIIGTMAPGASTTYTCTAANVALPFTNVAVATGKPPTGPDVTASDTADVAVQAPGTPAISIIKNPKSQTVANGGTATFTITVTNTGAVDLTNVSVTDPQSPNCNRDIGTLTPGQSISYTCTKQNVTSSFTNVATSTGTPPSGPSVSASDTAPVKAAALKPPKKPAPKQKPKVVAHVNPKATG